MEFTSLAANQNNSKAQFYLGNIYLRGEYIAVDIDKAIYYFSLTANQNDSDAQYNLGCIYSNGEYNTVDIDKGIHYYSLAANQNDSDAQYNLGCVFLNGEYNTVDINKAIHYFSLAASQNNSDAQFYLGNIFLNSKYITRNVNKAIHYYLLAVKQNDPDAQFCLGKLYFFGKYISLDIKKGIFYIINASLNMKRDANFAHAFLLHEGKYVKKDIQEAIHFYKEVSSFNNQYAKNNLGIIYKNGYGEEIQKNVFNAMVYFEEAIRQKGDYLSMYNLANIYLFDETVKHDMNKSIELLIKSSYKFIYSFKLLCILLIKQFEFNDVKIKREIEKRINEEEKKIFLLSKIFKVVNLLKYLGMSYVDDQYDLYGKKDFIYNIQLKPIPTSDLKLKIPLKYPKAKNITFNFYEGFGDCHS